MKMKRSSLRNLTVFTGIACLLYVGIVFMVWTKWAAPSHLESQRNPAEPLRLSENEYKNQVRTLPDSRPNDCKLRTQPTQWFKVSIVIFITNEEVAQIESTLLSVLANTPSNILHQILLVSHRTSVTTDKYLDKAAADHKSVQVVQLKQDGELTFKSKIVATLTVVTGDMIVFMEADMECNRMWIEPIVSHLADHPQTVVIPVLDNIDKLSGKYIGTVKPVKTGFSWDLQFMHYEPTFTELAHAESEADPLQTPVLTGNVFATTKENIVSWKPVPFEGSLELSFYLWLCGHEIILLPCSRVGKYSAYSVSSLPVQQHVNKVADKWLGQYKKYFYAATDYNNPSTSYTDVSMEINDLKQIKKCHDFDWYMNTVVLDLFKPVGDLAAFGTLKSQPSSMCFHVEVNQNLEGLRGQCSPARETGIFQLDADGLLRIHDRCVTGETHGYVTMNDCNPDDKAQTWTITSKKQIMLKSGQYCLMHNTDPDRERKDRQVLMAQVCRDDESFQQFVFSNFFDLKKLKSSR
ncbi:inactive polypeptide N-acetylgalactosaminyltransferase-like protein 5 [Lingula anatina]|uniref:Polypeptide N-acetylgalactosaminyltransferase n=1 Tax=Lingula anatina TaxID=7574 RepID=A0A1S3K9V4_LINAN|nr:inactive polypeptide N-acetylgalactosaminyltransferase-like protein 5 [Lingula anatina]|eukprot:XP_013419410.1 inactive polypeptide N-acetylgalactosaminyltransferase-like protein 5 [Lingula anatina]